MTTIDAAATLVAVGGSLALSANILYTWPILFTINGRIFTLIGIGEIIIAGRLYYNLQYQLESDINPFLFRAMVWIILLIPLTIAHQKLQTFYDGNCPERITGDALQLPDLPLGDDRPFIDLAVLKSLLDSKHIKSAEDLIGLFEKVREFAASAPHNYPNGQGPRGNIE